MDRQDSDRSIAVVPNTPLARWAAIPVAKANLRTLAGAAICISWLVFGSLLVENSRDFVLVSSLTLLVAHACVHMTTIVLLKQLGDQGRADARIALKAYRNPLRLNNLDLAMAWAAVAATSGVA